jgi:hypothetical protein
MCHRCDALSDHGHESQLNHPARRRLLGVGAAGGAATSLTPAQALDKLRAGNAKYVGAPQVCAVDVAQARAQVVEHQAPWASILSCADRRVLPGRWFRRSRPRPRPSWGSPETSPRTQAMKTPGRTPRASCSRARSSPTWSSSRRCASSLRYRLGDGKVEFFA